VDNDPSLDRLLRTINENSLSDRDIPAPSAAATRVASELAELESDATQAAREIVEMIEVEREPHPAWGAKAREKYVAMAAEIITRCCRKGGDGP
jgi:hypothetical protein